MTPPGSPAPATPPVTPVARLRNPGELLAALPYLIGFHPRDSLLFIAFGGSSGRRIELTQRVDLPPADDAPAVCRALAANVLRVAPAGVAVVVVGGDPVAAGGVPFGGPPPANDLAGVAKEALVACGVAVQSRTWAAGTGAGAAWACYDTCGCRGAVPDPDTTPLAATAVAAGLVALADRADLEKVVAPTTPGRLRRRARILTRAVDAALDPADPRGRLGVAVDPTDGSGEPVPTGHALVERALDEAAAGRLQLDDGRVVALALALSDVEVRDAALARCAASDVDGALAGIALDRAEQAWPGHRLTRLLRAVWAAGIPPERVRECLSAPEPPAMPVTRVAGRGRRRQRR